MPSKHASMRALPNKSLHLKSTPSTHIQQTYTKQAAGVEYSSRSMRLTEAQFKALPPITFLLDNGVEVRYPYC